MIPACASPTVRLASALAIFATPMAGLAQPTADESALWRDLAPGQHAVGFRVAWLTDAERDGPGATPAGRALRVYVWYPAVSGSGSTMSFGDYLAPEPPDTAWATLAEYLDQRDARTFGRQFSPPSDSASEALAATAVAARHDARPAPGSFPLVLHSLGRNDYQLESTVLWEYLASHGYVVAVPPQLGAGNEESTVSFTPEDMRRQADDLAFVLDRLSDTCAIAEGEVAVLGHSSGGIAALLLAAAEPRIRAVVGLDASFGTAEGRALLDSLAYPFAEQEAAVLHLHTVANRDRDLTTLVDMPRADRYVVSFGDVRPPRMATHFDFQNWPLYAVLTGREDDRGAGARTAEWAADVFLTAVRLTRSFLNHALRANGSEADWEPDVGAQRLDAVHAQVEKLEETADQR